MDCEDVIRNKHSKSRPRQQRKPCHYRSGGTTEPCFCCSIQGTRKVDKLPVSPISHIRFETRTSIMGSIEEQFRKAVRYVEELPREGPYKPTKEIKLRFYALYKQATESSCRTSRPGFFDRSGRAKWSAWNALGTMPRQEAMILYVDDYKRLRTRLEQSAAAEES